jgi:hypothetical protein
MDQSETWSSSSRLDWNLTFNKNICILSSWMGQSSTWSSPGKLIRNSTLGREGIEQPDLVFTRPAGSRPKWNREVENRDRVSYLRQKDLRLGSWNRDPTLRKISVWGDSRLTWAQETQARDLACALENHIISVDLVIVLQKKRLSL